MSTNDRWMKLIEEWNGSGEIASQWCRKKQLHYPSFITWRKKLLPLIKEAPASFIEVPQEDQSQTAVLEVKIQDFTLCLKKDFDEGLLRRSIKLLRSL